jgi:capsular exopolysaccharide synthesis family protein
MSKKNSLEPEQDVERIAPEGRERVPEAAREEGEADEADVVYDSMEAFSAEEDDVIELYDINAALGGEAGPRNTREEAATTQYALATATPGGQAAEAGPAFDGVLDSNVTIADGGRALMLARHAQTRHGVMVPFEDVTPELSPSSFAPGILAFSDPQNDALSQFRLLKIKVEEYIDTLRYRSIAITSTRGGEGKTTVALNLAVVMSENPWLKLALLDLNFRKPDLARLMRVPDGDPGLLHVLSGRASFDAALRKIEQRNLYLLHTGGRYEQSMNVLNSPQFDVFLNRLYESFDLVLIDCPPVVGCDDTLVIKQKVDGLFMVLRAELTPVNEMNKAATRLGKERILGVVLNHVRPTEVG